MFTPPAEKKVEPMKEKVSAPKSVEEKHTSALTGNTAGIHEDIRKMARKMDLEPPSLEAIKKAAYVPPAEDAEKDSKAIEKILKEVKSISGDSGKKSKAPAMTDADSACYASRYSDLKDKPAKEHFRLSGET